MIDIQISQSRVEIGDQVEAQVSWQVDGRQPDGVVIEVGWRTEGRGTVNEGVVGKHTVEIDDDDAFSTPWKTITTTIPVEAPVSYDGDLIRIRWGVHVRLDIPWARDEKANEEFWVLARER